MKKKRLYLDWLQWHLTLYSVGVLDWIGKLGQWCWSVYTWLSFRSSRASISRYPSARSSTMASFITAIATSFVISRMLQIWIRSVQWHEQYLKYKSFHFKKGYIKRKGTQEITAIESVPRYWRVYNPFENLLVSHICS